MWFRNRSNKFGLTKNEEKEMQDLTRRNMSTDKNIRVKDLLIELECLSVTRRGDPDAKKTEFFTLGSSHSDGELGT
jgi:hypothetical protein